MPQPSPSPRISVAQALLQTDEKLRTLRDEVARELAAVRNRIVENVAAVRSYGGSRTELMIRDGSAYLYAPTGTSPVDNVLVIEAEGKGSGQWIATNYGVIDLARFGVRYRLSSALVQAENVNAFQAAVNSGERISLRNSLYLDGTISVINLPLHLTGSGKKTVIHKQGDENLLFIESDAASKNQFYIADLNLAPVNDMIAGAAIRAINNTGGGNPCGTVERVTITRGASSEFAKGIWVTNPNELLLADVHVFGKGSSKLDHIVFDCNQASISPTLRRVKAYDGRYGFYSRSSSFPGIEGIKMVECDFVGMQLPVNIIADNVTNPGNGFRYFPPGIDIVSSNHINGSAGCINIEGYTQGKITGLLMYLNDSNEPLIKIKDTGNLSIAANEIFIVGGTGAHGIVLEGNCSLGKIYSNHINLINNTNYSGVHISGATEGAVVHDNTVFGGVRSVTDLTGKKNYIYNNTPPDFEDGQEFRTAVGGVLDVSTCRSEFIIIINPDNYVITNIVGIPLGKTFQFQCNNRVIMQHNAGMIMGGNADFQFAPGQTTGIHKQGLTELREVNRQPLNEALVVRGLTRQSLALPIMAGNFQAMNVASGFYDVWPAVTGMPSAGAGYNVVVTHAESQGLPGGGNTFSAIAFNKNNPALIYSGGRDNAGVWRAWTLMGSAGPAGPSTGQVRYHSGQFQYYDGTTWVPIGSQPPVPGDASVFSQSFPFILS